MAETTGERLRRLRGSRTIAEVAKACGISASSMAMYEYNKRTPRDDVKVRIAQFYRKSIPYIFFNTDTHSL